MFHLTNDVKDLINNLRYWEDGHIYEKNDNSKRGLIYDINNIDFSFVDHLNYNILMHAIINRRPKFCKKIINIKNIDLNIVSNEYTAIILAYIYGQDEIVDILLSKGANVNLGSTRLLIYHINRNKDINSFKKLMKYGLIINIPGWIKIDTNIKDFLINYYLLLIFNKYNVTNKDILTYTFKFIKCT